MALADAQVDLNQDQVNSQRADLITNFEGKLSQKVERRELLVVHWALD